ncbi:hypothetical protein HDU77_004189 [Chytriomyces hyalinus]|nr:hypothetical protein HDU77_004189 [Chytriomyces hyalinus]
MINTTFSIDAQIKAVLGKKEFLFKLQSEQVAQILATVKVQVDCYVQLSEQAAIQVTLAKNEKASLLAAEKEAQMKESS